MKLSWRSELPNLLIVAAMFLVAGLSLGALPEVVPTRWTFDGVPTQYGPKTVVLLLLPAIALSIYALLTLAPRIDPGRRDYSLFAGSYVVLRFATLLTTAALYVLIVLAVSGRAVDVAAVVPLVIGVPLVLIGGVLGKLRPNWFFRIRTPRTLSSKRSWTRTRLGLFLFSGILLILAGITRSPLLTATASGAALLVAITLLISSYFVWRSDPEKIALAGTSPADE